VIKQIKQCKTAAKKGQINGEKKFKNSLQVKRKKKCAYVQWNRKI